MTKEEIALQLTLARIDKLEPVETKRAANKDQNKLHNQSIAEETIKLFNAIFQGIDPVDRD